MAKTKGPKEPKDMQQYFMQALVNSCTDSFHACGWDRYPALADLLPKRESIAFFKGRWKITVPVIIAPKLYSWCGDEYTPTFAFKGETVISCGGEERFRITDMPGGHGNTEYLLILINEVEHILVNGVDRKFREDSRFIDPEFWEPGVVGEATESIAYSLIKPELEKFLGKLPRVLRKKWERAISDCVECDK